MKNLILALVAMFGALTSTQAALHQDDVGTSLTYNEFANMRDKYAIWLEACLYTQYTCAGIAVPNVKYERMRRGLYGYYDGSDTVYVNSRVSRQQKRATLYHEMIHYLQKFDGGLRVPGPAKEICYAEAEAFAEGDERWRRIGKSNKQTGPNWWRPYTHCHPWFDPKFNPRKDFWKFFAPQTND